ncbi:MAG: hypothetical protein L6302_09720, partial [Desulfobacteraceae bacterium]|nr:hypothetical protein [Desulfobacteraceae bacterium]
DAYAADNISGNFDITRISESTTTEGEKDISRSLNQNYNLVLRKDLTSRIYFTTNAGINMTDTDGTETTRLSPQFRLNIANNYFNANTGYLLNETGLDMFGMDPDQTRLTTETWTSNFSTNSVKYPNIRFRYDEDRTYDDLSPNTTDSLSKYYDLTGDYTYKFMTFTLRHTKDNDYDYVNDADDTTTVNEGRLNFRESFWDSRITSSGTYTITDTENENVTPTVTTSTDTTRKDLVFDAGLRLRPFKWSRISYDYELDNTDTDTDAGADTERTVQAHNISIRGDAELHKYLKSWAQYQKRLQYNSDGDDTSTDTFTLNFDSRPIETLNTNLIFNHLINKTESETQSKTYSTLLHIIANIWEGVDLSVDGQINYTDNIVGDTQTLSKTVNSDLRLKLTKTLTTEVNYITEWTDTESADGTETSTFNYTISTDVYYRPVRSFYLHFAYELKQSEDAEDSNYYITDINWLMTEKLRFNMQYKLDENSNEDTAFTSDLVWNMSKIFMLRFKYDYDREENTTLTKTHTFTTFLSAKF